MRTVRTLAALLAVAVLGACADSPTTAAAPPADALASSSTLGQIQVNNIVDHGSFWRIHLSTAGDSSITGWAWYHSGGTGQNPWGNGVYKYIIDRSKAAGPGCVFVQLTTSYAGGGTTHDYEAVRVGGYRGDCPFPF